MSRPAEAQRVAAEFLGTAALLSAVVGSGIVAATDGPASTQLFSHALTVGVTLIALICMFGPVSGAHFNPAVTAAGWWFGGLPGDRALRYVAAQTSGGLVGTLATNAMFGLDVVAISSAPRDGLGMVGGEALATAGLVLVIFALVHSGRTSAVPGAVGAWVGAAIFFTASASFANPAVTVARTFTDTYTGIDPSSIPGFLAGQTIGTAGAIALVAWMYGPSQRQAGKVVVAHDDSDRPAASEPAVTRGGHR